MFIKGYPWNGYLRFLPKPILFCQVICPVMSSYCLPPCEDPKSKRQAAFSLRSWSSMCAEFSVAEKKIRYVTKGDAYPKTCCFYSCKPITYGRITLNFHSKELEAPGSQGCRRRDWMQVGLDNMEKTSKRPVQLPFNAAPWQLVELLASYNGKVEHSRSTDAPHIWPLLCSFWFPLTYISESFISSNLLSYLYV